jgi:hypothetical protein
MKKINEKMAKEKQIKNNWQWAIMQMPIVRAVLWLYYSIVLPIHAKVVLKWHF